MFDSIIIGAGFAGAVAAERLVSKGGGKVLLIEKRPHIGGNCYDSVDDNNIMVHRYGPHLFHTDNRSVFEYLSRFTGWHYYRHTVRAHIDGQNVPVPFNLNSIRMVFPEQVAASMEEALSAAYEYGSKVPILELRKSANPNLRRLANYIYNKVFAGYTAKQWGMSPEEIDPSVTARVPVAVGRDDRYFGDCYQAVPSKGYTSLFGKLIAHPDIKLILNTDFSEIGGIGEDGFRLFGEPFKGRVIYSGMIDELFGYRYGELPYRSVKMEFESLECDRYQECGTVNYPNDYDFTRITEFKHIHPSTSDRTTVLREYPTAYRRGENLPYYPVFTDANRGKYEQYRKCAEQYGNLVLLGRLAEYRYYDMDDIVAKALEI